MAYLKNANIIEKKVEAGLLLFDTDSSKMVELNATAALLWQESPQRFSKPDLEKIINARCTGAKNVDADLAEFLKTALKLNLVTDDGEN